MTKSILIATVAALAITAPAQAQRDDRREKAERSEQRTERQARPQREQRVRAERPQRQERVRAERPQRQERVRAERPQREQRVRMERPQREQRVRAERPQREQRVRAERPQRQQRVQVERQRPQVRERSVERRARNVERVRPQRAERQRVERQRVARPQRVERNARTQQRAAQRRVERRSVIEQRTNRGANQQLRQQQRQGERFARTQNRIDRRNDRLESRATQRVMRQAFADNRLQRPSRSLGERVNLRERRASRDWYDNYAVQRHSSFYGASPSHFYDYDYNDGYLYQLDRDSYAVTGMYPLLGGAFSTGRMLPIGFDSYNVPYAYRSLYYDTPDYFYRYGDGGIYQVDSSTMMIQAVVALLTGQTLGVGQMLPMGYDVYNVPYAYRDRYYDTSDAWYRYDDGYIYQVDPYSRMIENMYPVSYGGYAVGYPLPSYASYGGYTGYSSYAMPYGYQNLYYGAPGYNYHYANNGIYQVDPSTQLISALVALVTGSSFGIGQTLPMGYDVYNVPYAYRSTYFDTDDSWYRYDDGYIYEVDPYSRVIESAIPVAYDGYAVGYPVPATYPGYAVPASYGGLYAAAPGYDYRYFDGGIYAIDPDTRIVRSVAALTTGHTFGVGQMLPVGYDVYNVPYAYRDRYYDNDRYMYRYADGYIYQVDPQTRLIQAVIDAVT